jgi:transcriptional regulator with XRE-family HTH domain
MGGVVAQNVRDRRALGRFSQEALAGRMRQLGHDWSRTTVGDIEREVRSVSIDELFALTIVLEIDLVDLLDPLGAAGDRTTPVDYGRSVYRTMPAVVAHHWLHGRVHVRLSGPGGIWIAQVDDYETEFMECQKALQRWNAERAQHRAEELANEEKERP